MKSLMVFQTDFTYKEGAVCAMYGVVKSVDRELEILDGTHEIPQYDTWSASYRLFQSMKFWPKDTVFVSVVDPGVGTPRKASVARTSDGYYVVTPDNGSLTHLKKLVGIEEIREIDENINRLKGKGTEDVAIFHGRDVFAFCGARLAAGVITFEQVGPEYPVDEIIEHEILEPKINHNLVKGIIEIPDPNFGNSWTNISLKKFRSAGFEYGDMINVLIKNKEQIIFDKKILFHQSFGFAVKGQPMIYNNELMNVAFAVNQGSFFETYGIGYGADWSVEFSK